MKLRFAFVDGVPRDGWFLLLALAVGGGLASLPLAVAVGVAGATAVLLLTFINPLIGLGVTLLAGPLGALEGIIWGGSAWDSGQLLLLLTLLAWGMRGMLRRRLILPHTFLNLPLALFVLLAALTLVPALSITIGFKEVLKWVEIGFIVWLIADLGPERTLASPNRLWIVGMLLLAGLSQAVIGIWQFGLRPTGPEHFLVLDRFYRAYGTFEQPNPFGGFMSLTAFLSWGVVGGLLLTWIKARGESGQDGAEKEAGSGWFWLGMGFALICAGATSLALVLSWSRGAWLGAAAGAAVFILFWPPKRWQGVALLALLGLFLVLALQFDLLPASIAERIGNFTEDVTFGDVRGVDVNGDNYAVVERLAHWQSALDMARAHLWLGVGFGNYEPAYADYALINWPDALGHAHNYYLNILAEMGVLGLLAYLFFWTAVLGQTIRLWHRGEGLARGIALGLLAAWFALSVHHLVDKLYVNNIYIHLGVMLGLLHLLTQQTNNIKAIEG